MAALGIYPGAEMDLLCSGCVRVNGGVLSLSKDISEKILVTPSP
jgi:ferrous iron transport protein A